jgi:hypothetical protein
MYGSSIFTYYMIQLNWNSQAIMLVILMSCTCIHCSSQQTALFHLSCHIQHYLVLKARAEKHWISYISIASSNHLLFSNCQEFVHNICCWDIGCWYICHMSYVIKWAGNQSHLNWIPYFENSLVPLLRSHYM